MTNNITVGVILPAYNAMGTIDRAINSVLNQTHRNVILYIIDDCSTDGTRDKLKSYVEDSRVVVLFNERNLGVSATRNRGLDNNQQQIVAYIDSDDEWKPEKLTKQLEQFFINNEMPCVSAYNYLSINHKLVHYHSNILSKVNFLKKDFRICLSSLVHKRNDARFKNVGHEDFLFIYDLLQQSNEICIVNQPLVNYHVIEGSLSSNKLKAASWHFKLLLNEMNLTKFKVFYYFLFYSINAVLFINK